eukprot:m.160829 g.160829  ORF g.160829 m.160829 type:complete len:72 (-) comp23812_c0_seq1:381-596(-)
MCRSILASATHKTGDLGMSLPTNTPTEATTMLPGCVPSATTHCSRVTTKLAPVQEMRSKSTEKHPFGLVRQ